MGVAIVCGFLLPNNPSSLLSPPLYAVVLPFALALQLPPSACLMSSVQDVFPSLRLLLRLRVRLCSDSLPGMTSKTAAGGARGGRATPLDLQIDPSSRLTLLLLLSIPAVVVLAI